MTNVFEVAALSSLMQLYPALPAKESVPTLLQQDLYFGRNIGATGRVTEQQFRQFLKDVVAPRFSTGITVYDAKGQFLNNDGDLIREPSKVISLVYADKASNQQAINDIITAYKRQFQQESVLQVENEDIAVGLGQGEDLITNDPTPELIQVDLYFGRNIGTTGWVSDRQFRQFLEDVVTPLFPNGLTAYDTKDQSLDRSNRLIREPSKVVSLILEDTEQNEQSLYQIVDAYEDQFQQDSVLQVVNEAVSVGFGQGENLIDNDPIPELIQVDLYYGRNIGTTGQVSDRQFRQFLRNEITPRFPDGLTVYDADGQFLDSSNQLIREPSNVVSLILEDTQANEQLINQVIDLYKQKFQQESVLVVVDETLGIAFDVEASAAPTSLTPSIFDFSNPFEQNKQPYFAIAPETSVSPF
jgi:Protein of unknown function (DUF3574)